MTQHTVSAQPEMLYRYADCGAELDQELITSADRLINTLNRFEQCCSESAFRVSTTQLGYSLKSYGKQNLPHNEHVRFVGRRFARADGMRVGDNEEKSWLDRLKQRLGSIDVRKTVSKVLPFVPIIGPPAWLALQVKELPWVEVEGNYTLDNQDVNNQTSDNSNPTPPSTTVNTGKAGLHISQKNPTGPDSFLDLKRKETETTWEAKVGETVRDHIGDLGCLMTCYTMLLNDIGIDVDVTDLYREKYKMSNPNKDFDKDAEDGVVILFDLLTPLGIIANIASSKGRQGVSGRSGFLSGTTHEERIESLKDIIDKRGTVVIHVTGDPTYGHWIVVDGYNESGFSVRDPLKASSQKNVRIGVPDGDYHLHDFEIRYIMNDVSED